MKQIAYFILTGLVSLTGIVEAQQSIQVNGRVSSGAGGSASAAAGKISSGAGKESFLTLAEFAVRVKSSAAQLVDVRSGEEFIQSHLKGAIWIDPAAADYARKLAALSKDKPVYVYSIANGRSVTAAADFRSKGFKEVHVLPGGIANWIGSGYPIVSHTKKGVELSSAQFETLTESAELVLVDFGSKYCGACKQLIPVLDSLEKKQDFKTKVIRIEAYDNTLLIKKLKINQLPTLVLFQGGKQVWKKAGLSSAEEIENNINTKRHE
ncbi:thioredoxin domain-containing protein [Pedobacter lusitanus]|nr:thioredoxin domain-containing protein [Pedobacter lusitanus]